MPGMFQSGGMSTLRPSRLNNVDSPRACCSGVGGLARRFLDGPLYPRREGVYWQIVPEEAQRPQTGALPSHLRCFCRQVRQASSDGPEGLGGALDAKETVCSVMTNSRYSRGASETCNWSRNQEYMQPNRKSHDARRERAKPAATSGIHSTSKEGSNDAEWGWYSIANRHRFAPEQRYRERQNKRERERRLEIIQVERRGSQRLRNDRRDATAGKG